MRIGNRNKKNCVEVWKIARRNYINHYKGSGFGECQKLNEKIGENRSETPEYEGMWEPITMESPRNEWGKFDKESKEKFIILGRRRRGRPQ